MRVACQIKITPNIYNLNVGGYLYAYILYSPHCVCQSLLDKTDLVFVHTPTNDRHYGIEI